MYNSHVQTVPMEEVMGSVRYRLLFAEAFEYHTLDGAMQKARKWVSKNNISHVEDYVPRVHERRNTTGPPGYHEIWTVIVKYKAFDTIESEAA